MRITIIAVALLLLTVAAFGADTELTIFASNISYAESSGNSQFSGGVGLALSKVWNSHWSTELAVATEQHRAPFTRFEYLPLQPVNILAPVTEIRSFRIYPADLTASYRFTNSSRFTPYITGGLRYVNAPNGERITVITGAMTPSGAMIPVNGGFEFRGGARRSAEMGAGGSVRLTPHVSFRFGFMQLLRTDSVSYDPLSRGTFGVSWKF